ncbi:restriction endonuclease [Streptomyces sp. NPDC059785]|uniref:restriction endonuclease n=1 Tax=unclassified Streptomyces TaxID=2593676 RepID=UPI003659E46D
MAARRGRKPAARKKAAARRRAAARRKSVARRQRGAARGRAANRRTAVLAGGLLLAVLLASAGPSLWPYVLAGPVVVAAVGAGWAGHRLWRTDRLLRDRDRAWRRREAVRDGHRTLAGIDVLSGGEFEEVVADLCRRDGCTGVRTVGGSGDNGADVVGRLPDGRSMVVQCKRYAPARTVAGRELRDLLGARVHFGADVAVFVTTSRFSRQSEAFAAGNGILAVHRDHLGLWNNGTSLVTLMALNGSGQGDARHRARWKRTYGT